VDRTGTDAILLAACLREHPGNLRDGFPPVSGDVAHIPGRTASMLRMSGSMTSVIAVSAVAAPTMSN
jgi:hypothetical protein